MTWSRLVFARHWHSATLRVRRPRLDRRSGRAHWDSIIGTVLAALVGADVGPIVTPFGSLATMLVLALARRDGHELRTNRFDARPVGDTGYDAYADSLLRADSLRAGDDPLRVRPEPSVVP